MFNLVVMFCVGYEVVAWIINSGVGDQDGGKEARLSESTCIISVREPLRGDHS